MYSPSGQQSPNILSYNCLFTNTCQTAISDHDKLPSVLMEHWKLYLPPAFKQNPARTSQFLKHQIYGAEFLTKNASPIPWSPLPHCHLLSCDSRSLDQRQQSIKETWLRIAQPFSILPEQTHHQSWWINKSYHNKWINHTIQKSVTSREGNC